MSAVPRKAVHKKTAEYPAYDISKLRDNEPIFKLQDTW